jgi:D-alanine-D-alanine ligase
VDTIDSIAGTLEDLGYVPERIGNLKQLAARLVAGERWDLVFNICEGMHGIGREAQVPALLDAYGIPYVFSDPLVCALTLHKGMTKRVVRDAGVRTPEFAVVAEPADLRHVELPFPLFAKPVAEGTGKGVTTASRVENRRQLQRVVRALLREFRQPVLIERFLPGREFTVGILGTGQAATALATLEIVLLPEADANVYSYRNKEQCEELVRYRLLEEDLMRRDVEQLALDAWQALGCRDGGRIDIRLDEHGAPHFLEVNPLAGIHPEHSDLPIMATLVGVPYRDLIGRIMDSALGRIDAAQARPARVAA